MKMTGLLVDGKRTCCVDGSLQCYDYGHSLKLGLDSGFWTLDSEIYIYYLPAGRSVLRKTVPEVLSTARGRRPRAVLKTEGTVFLNTDRPRPANNIFIFFLLFFKS